MVISEYDCSCLTSLFVVPKFISLSRLLPVSLLGIGHGLGPSACTVTWTFCLHLTFGSDYTFIWIAASC